MWILKIIAFFQSEKRIKRRQINKGIEQLIAANNELKNMPKGKGSSEKDLMQYYKKPKKGCTDVHPDALLEDHYNWVRK